MLLDCKRIVPPPHGKKESLKEKNLRVSSQWESDCAFESDDHWVDEMRRTFDVHTLVDQSGDVMESDSDDQADMCELIRALVHGGKFQDSGPLTKLNFEFVSQINCAGFNK